MQPKLSLFAHPDSGWWKSQFSSDPQSNFSTRLNATFVQTNKDHKKKKSNKLSLWESDCALDPLALKRVLRHEKGYSSPGGFLAVPSPDCRYVTFQDETEHGASKQGEFSVSQKICAVSTAAGKIATNTLSASVGIFQCRASCSACG